MRLFALFLFFCLSTLANASSNNEKLAQLLLNHSAASSEGKDDVAQFNSGLRALAKENNRESQFLLGVQAMTGAIGGAEGILWLHKAERNGCSGAAGILGRMYLDGMGGVQKDEAMGLKWTRNAAERGEIMSQVFLAAQYLHGENHVPKDLVQAYSWMYQASKAAADEPAIVFALNPQIKMLESSLTSTQIQEAQKLADDRIRKIGGVPRYVCAQILPMHPLSSNSK
ncbi:MAG: hypothetical protein V4528_10520 [Pseudomonadota bacterium]